MKESFPEGLSAFSPESARLHGHFINLCWQSPHVPPSGINRQEPKLALVLDGQEAVSSMPEKLMLSASLHMVSYHADGCWHEVSYDSPLAGSEIDPKRIVAWLDFNRADLGFAAAVIRDLHL